MCLYVDWKLQHRAKKRKGTVTRYKVLRKGKTTTEWNTKTEEFFEKTSNGLFSPIQTKRWRPGSNKCSLPKKPRLEDAHYKVHEGIHVYKTRADALNDWGGEGDKEHQYVILPVKCDAKDLMGVGDTEEVYYRIFLDKKDYEKGIANHKSVIANQVKTEVPTSSTVVGV
jgi:hypothetical protein